MPTYEYHCPKCDRTLEVLQSMAEMRAATPRCNRCKHRMQFVFPAPTIRTSKQFQANRDDGFGNDERGRRRAYAKAKRQGIDVNGKWWSPQLNSWIGGKDDALRICRKQRKTLTVNDRVEYVPPPQEPEPEKPYQVAPDIVQKAVAEIKAEHGHEMTAKELRELPEKTREELSGVW